MSDDQDETRNDGLPNKKVVHKFSRKERPVIAHQDGLPPRERLEAEALQEPVSQKDYAETLIEELEENWGHAPERNSSRRSLIISLVAIGILLSSSAIWSLFRVQNPMLKVHEVNSSRHQEKGDLKKREDALYRYLSADTVAKKAAFVRNRKTVEPLMQDYYRSRPLVVGNLTQRFSFFKAESLGDTIWLAKTQGRNYIYMELTADGEYLIDWPSDVVYQENDWAQFVEEKSSDPTEFRVLVKYAQLDGVHAFEFSEYNRYRCFRLTLPDSDAYLWGYTEVDSVVDRELVKYCSLAKGKKVEIPATVKIKFPVGGISNRYVHIDSLECRGWAKDLVAE